MAANTLFKSPLGGMIGGFEDYETELGSSSQPTNNKSDDSNSNPLANMFLSAPADLIAPVSSITVDLAKDSADALVDLGKTIFGVGEKQGKKFSAKGSIDNFQKPNEEQAKKNQESQFKRMFYSSLQEDQRNTRSFNSEKAMQDAVRLEVTAMSTTDKLNSLHMSLDLDEKHINNPYHINELRRKKLEQIKKAKAEKQSQELAAVTKKGNLLMNQNAHEGQSLTSSSGAIAGAG